MSEDITGIEKVNATLDRMASHLDGRGKYRLIATIARAVSRSNAKRIRKNVTPEGALFEPRRERRGKKKPIRMFRKLSSSKHLKTRHAHDAGEVGFFGGDAGIARVHHYGLRDRLTRKFKLRVKYHERPLLDINANDMSMIEEIIESVFTDKGRWIRGEV
ncbi:virion morphogenesis protein [Betaproteobacteria bacterium]|nr:virion morphogenesis protein [Betaproteobacteria bacterium]